MNIAYSNIVILLPFNINLAWRKIPILLYIVHIKTDMFLYFQVLLDRTSIRSCLAELYDVPESSVNITLIYKANLSIGLERSVCNTDTPTLHFPEVCEICLLCLFNFICFVWMRFVYFQSVVMIFLPYFTRFRHCLWQNYFKIVVLNVKLICHYVRLKTVMLFVLIFWIEVV